MEHHDKEINEPARGLNDEQLVEHVSDYLKEFQKTGPKIIALIAGAAAGKTSFVRELSSSLGRTAVLGTDDYLKGDRNWRRSNIEDAGKDPILKYNRAYLNDQVRKIIELQDGQEIGVPVYDDTSGVAISPDPENEPNDSTYPKKIKGRQDYIIVEGDFQFLDPDLVDKVIFFDVDDTVRLENRLQRDVVKRGGTIEGTTANFNMRQNTQFLLHTLPHKENADLMITIHAIPLEQPTDDRKYLYSYDIVQKTN